MKTASTFDLPCNFFSVSQYFCNSVKYLSSMNTFDRPNVAMILRECTKLCALLNPEHQKAKNFKRLFSPYEYLLVFASFGNTHYSLHCTHSNADIQNIMLETIISSAPKVAQ